MPGKRTEAPYTRRRSAAYAKQAGVTTVEYAVMLALVALLVLTFGTQIGDSVKDTFNKLVVALGGSGGGSADSGSGAGGGTAAGDTGSTGNNGRGNSYGNAPGGNGNGNGGNGNGLSRGLN